MNNQRYLLDENGQYFSDLLHVECRTKNNIFFFGDENLVFVASLRCCTLPNMLPATPPPHCCCRDHYALAKLPPRPPSWLPRCHHCQCRVLAKLPPPAPSWLPPPTPRSCQAAAAAKSAAAPALQPHFCRHHRAFVSTFIPVAVILAVSIAIANFS